jgi:hypothetical protein
LLAAGAVALAFSTQVLDERRDALNAIAARHSGSPSTASTPVLDSAAGLQAASMLRQVAYPWAQLLREIETVRGFGVRVISLEHDAGSDRATLIIEVPRAADVNVVLSRLEDGHRRWTTESVTAEGQRVRARLRGT